MNVLVTSGPTWVAIDDVRVLSNTSTGEMGSLIVDAFLKIDAQVTMLEGPVVNPRLPAKNLKVLRFKYFDELAVLLNKQLTKKFDVVIHAAAVSDFKLARPYRGKISSGKGISLALVPTPKLINEIRKQAVSSCLVGFKLLPALPDTASHPAVKSLIKDSGLDVVVVNSIQGGYKAFVADADGNMISQMRSKAKVAQELVRILM